MSDNQDFRVELDAETGVATLWMQMAGRANKINQAFGSGFVAALDEAVDGQDVAVGLPDVLLVRTISADTVDEGLDRGPVSLSFFAQASGEV